jgi:hypothetical protein
VLPPAQSFRWVETRFRESRTEIIKKLIVWVQYYGTVSPKNTQT